MTGTYFQCEISEKVELSKDGTMPKGWFHVILAGDRGEISGYVCSVDTLMEFVKKSAG